MSIVFLVAVLAAAGRFAVLLAGHMTAAALRLRMFAQQGEIRELMVESPAVEFDDIGIQAQMLVVAIGAHLRLLAPMEALACSQIRTDFLVALDA